MIDFLYSYSLKMTLSLKPNNAVTAAKTYPVSPMNLCVGVNLDLDFSDMVGYKNEMKPPNH